jgi:uncharacterized membrane protein YcaP (DUF421 family)
MELYDLWESGLGVGLEAKDLNVTQMALRAVAIYVAILAIVRLAKKRFLGSATPFDVVVGIIIGSIASRTITGNAPMLPSMAAAAAIVAMHWLFSAAAVRSHGFGSLIKGKSRLLIKDGAADESMLRAVHMTEDDLKEALRQQGVTEVGQVAEARLERDGSVSVVER